MRRCGTASDHGGVIIGEDALVGAGSVETRDIAPHTMVAGNRLRRFEPTPPRPGSGSV